MRLLADDDNGIARGVFLLGDEDPQRLGRPHPGMFPPLFFLFGNGIARGVSSGDEDPQGLGHPQLMYTNVG